jgi:hypothetical protein
MGIDSLLKGFAYSAYLGELGVVIYLIRLFQKAKKMEKEVKN